MKEFNVFSPTLDKWTVTGGWSGSIGDLRHTLGGEVANGDIITVWDAGTTITYRVTEEGLEQLKT